MIDFVQDPRYQKYYSYKLGGLFELSNVNANIMIKFIVHPNMQCTIQIITSLQDRPIGCQLLHTLEFLIGLPWEFNNFITHFDPLLNIINMNHFCRCTSLPSLTLIDDQVYITNQLQPSTGSLGRIHISSVSEPKFRRRRLSKL